MVNKILTGIAAGLHTGQAFAFWLAACVFLVICGVGVEGGRECEIFVPRYWHINGSRVIQFHQNRSENERGRKCTH